MPTNLGGLNILLRQFARLENQLVEAVAEETEKAAQELAETARELAPVASGRLRDSIQAVQDAGGFWKVGTDVPYAAARELGVRNAPATPFLFPAYLLVRQRYLDNLSHAIRNLT